MGLRGIVKGLSCSGLGRREDEDEAQKGVTRSPTKLTNKHGGFRLSDFFVLSPVLHTSSLHTFIT